jgi:hypothetical protein
MHTAIVRVEDNRVAKFKEFEVESEASEHCDEYGGFVYEGRYRPDLWVDGEEITIRPIE